MTVEIDVATLRAIRVLQRECELTLSDHGEVLDDEDRESIQSALSRVAEVFGPRVRERS